MKTKKSGGANIDAIFQGQAFGSVANMLANGLNVNTLRTWIGKDGRSYMNVNNKAVPIRNAATLRKDEWKQFDTAVLDVARQRLIGINDLISRGLTYDIANGLGTMVLEYEKISDMSDAQINMDAVTRAANDRLEFTMAYLPLPIVHKDFQLSARALEASRKLGRPLDTTQAGVAALKVSEMNETILFTGASTYTFGGGTIYGYTDFPYRTTGSLTAHWDDSGATGATILADVLNMKQDSINDLHYGPWILYVPTNYDAPLDDDFKANSDLTIRARLKQIAGIEDVKVADFLTADNVVLVEMRPETVRMVVGMQPTTVEWQTEGNLVSHFKVMSIMVPQLRCDVNEKSGIVHYTK